MLVCTGVCERSGWAWEGARWAGQARAGEVSKIRWFGRESQDGGRGLPRIPAPLCEGKRTPRSPRMRPWWHTTSPSLSQSSSSGLAAKGGKGVRVCVCVCVCGGWVGGGWGVGGHWGDTRSQRPKPFSAARLSVSNMLTNS